MTCEACRTLPPVVPNGYTPNGQYSIIAGLRTYVTGPTSATIGLIGVYDIFGLAIQTLQGADLLASQLSAVVLVPDFFHGDAAQHDWLPANTDEKKKLLSEFINGKAAFPQNVQALKRVVEAGKYEFPGVEKWGSYGLCWGGKVVVLLSGSDAPFTASGQVHPGRLEKADAERLTIPHIVLASKDEPTGMVEEYSRVIDSSEIGGQVETYSSMWHGWMGARANLDDEHNRAEYTRGYAQLAGFFKKYLK
ncbi:hypothetical protein BJX99DRAFT_235210 [Aspergillus californicus]